MSVRVSDQASRRRTKTEVDYGANGGGPGAATSPPPFTASDIDSLDACEVGTQSKCVSLGMQQV